jgi:hypothetical protein
MKGAELPINTIIIIVLAMIVLLAVAALYFTGFGPFSTAVGLEGEKNSACRVLVQEKRCEFATNEIKFDGTMVQKFDANKDNSLSGDTTFGAWGAATNCGGGAAGTSKDNLASLCQCFFGVTSEGQCRTMCGCPGY